MPLKAGDKCPQCKEGLLERTELGLSCSKCSYDLEMAEVIAANKREETVTGKYVFKPRTFKITVETPEEGEEFLRGLILAKQNVNCDLFQDLVDVTNTILEPWRAARLKQELQARGS